MVAIQAQFIRKKVETCHLRFLSVAKTSAPTSKETRTVLAGTAFLCLYQASPWSW